MKAKLALTVAFCLLCYAAALAQGAADRAASRTESTRAKAEGRFNRLEQSQTRPFQEEVIQKKVITVPAKKPSARGVQAERIAKPTTKRITVRKRVTVQKPVPLRINPY